MDLHRIGTELPFRLASQNGQIRPCVLWGRRLTNGSRQQEALYNVGVKLAARCVRRSLRPRRLAGTGLLVILEWSQVA